MQFSSRVSILHEVDNRRRQFWHFDPEDNVYMKKHKPLLVATFLSKRFNSEEYEENYYGIYYDKLIRFKVLATIAFLCSLQYSER